MYWPSDSEVNTIKAEVWDFPVMTEGTRLISYLLYGLFSAILKKNTVKTPEVIFRINIGMLVFLSVIENIVVLCPSVFAHAHVVLLTTQKSRRAEKKIHNARSLQENNARSAANQSARTIVAI